MTDSRVFNWRFYLYSNPDLINYGLTTEAQAVNHWVNNGVYEGRQAHPAFHAAQYLLQYPDLRNAFGYNYTAATQHYLSYGNAEGRFGHSTWGAQSMQWGRTTVTSKWTGSPSSWYNPMTVSVATKFAGAIDSIMWKDFEYINAYDHGRQAGFAWQYGSSPTGTTTQPTFDALWSEMFNPTESGTETDAVGYGSSSQLLSYNHIDTNVIETSNQAAYWKPISEGQGNYNNVLSADVIRKVIVVSPMGVPNLTRISSFIYPETGNPKKAIPCRYEVPALYINPDLQYFYECNQDLTALTQVPNTKHPKFSNTVMWDGNPAGGWYGSQGGEVNGVVIASDGAGHAIGTLVIPSAAYSRISYQMYFQNHQCGTTSAINRTRSMGAAVYVDDGSRYREFTTYIAVGNTPQDVLNTLKLVMETKP